MQSSTLVLLVIVSVASAETLLSYVPANYHVYLNAQAKSDMGKLTNKDFNALKQVAEKAPQFTSLNQLHAAVQKASPQATALVNKYAQKATQQVNQIKSKLSPSSKQLFAELSTLAQNFARQANRLLQKQDAPTKANLGQVFSHAGTFLNSPAGKTIVQHLKQHQ